MSKFFSQDSDASSDDDEDKSSSEEESSEEEESEEEEKKVEKKEVTADAKPKGMAAFMKDADDDDSSDDDSKRVVRSQRDRKWEQMTEAIAELKVHLKGDDWVKVSGAFDNVNKMLAKAATLIAREGMPAFYFKLLILLEADTDKATEDKAALKKMSSANAKAVNTLKQKLRKVCKPYEKELGKLRDKKSAAAGDDDDDDDEPPAAAPTPEKGGKKVVKGGRESIGPKKIEDYNEAEIDERLDELLGKRGRKGTKKQDEIAVLKALSNVTKRPSKLVELLGHIISFYFDIHNNMLTAMPTAVWKEVFQVHPPRSTP